MLGCRVIWLSILSKRRVALVREGDVRLCDSQFFKTRANPHRKPGMSKVAYHRMLVGGLEVVKRAKRWNTIGPSQKQQPLKLACAQCSVAAWHGRGSTKFCFACNITPIQTGGCLRMQRGRWGWSIGKILTPPPPQNHRHESMVKQKAATRPATKNSQRLVETKKLDGLQQLEAKLGDVLLLIFPFQMVIILMPLTESKSQPCDPPKTRSTSFPNFEKQQPIHESRKDFKQYVLTVVKIVKQALGVHPSNKADVILPAAQVGTQRPTG